MAKREKTSLSLDPELMIAVGHRCLDLRIDKSDAVEAALRQWLDPARPQTAGEFIKCPSHIRELVNTMIVRLCAMDNSMLPAMEKLLVRFSEPGAIEDVLSAEGRRTLLGPRAVPNKK